MLPLPTESETKYLFISFGEMILTFEDDTKNNSSSGNVIEVSIPSLKVIGPNPFRRTCDNVHYIFINCYLSSYSIET